MAIHAASLAGTWRTNAVRGNCELKATPRQSSFLQGRSPRSGGNAVGNPAWLREGRTSGLRERPLDFPSRGQVTVPLTIGRAGRGQVNLRQPRCRAGELGEDTLTSDNPDAAKRGMQMHNLREDDLRPTDGASQAACGMTAVPSQAQQRFAQTGEQRKRRDERGHSGRREKTLHIEKCADGTSVRMVPPISPLSLTWTANPPPAPCCSNHLDATTRNRKKMTAPTPPAPPASAPCRPSHKMGLTTG